MLFGGLVKVAESDGCLFAGRYRYCFSSIISPPSSQAISKHSEHTLSLDVDLA